MTRSSARLARDCVLPSLACAALALLGPTVWSLLFAQASYDGVQDDGVSTSARERYGSYLWSVAGALGVVALTELVLLATALVGLSFLWRLSIEDRPSSRRVWALHLSAASIVTATYFGFIADQHPGLFLSSLSGSWFAYPALTVARFLAPGLATMALAGYLLAVIRGTVPTRAVIVLLALGVGGGVYARRRAARLRVHVPYGTVEAKAEGQEKEKAKKDKEAKAPTKKKRAERPSILWIGVDSLRPDKIDAEHTPNIARLIGESVYFPNTIVTVPRTGPSWVATLTSLSPLTNGVETMFPDGRAGRLSKIGMPAHLVARGYRTGVFSDYAGEFFGRVDLGFQLQSVPEVELREIAGQLLLTSAPLVLAQVGALYSLGPFERGLLGEPIGTLIRGMTSFTHPPVLERDLDAWLDEDHDTPFFGLVFYSQPHFPYASNGPWYRKYHVPGSSSSIAFGRDVANETPITKTEDLRQIDALYRGALAESDAAIGKLLDGLEAAGRLKDTIIVLTADHGEGLYDCSSCVGHGDNLRSMFTLRTPLAIRLPTERYRGAAPARVDAWVSQLDIYPTLLALVGEPAIPIHEGVPLLAASGAQTPLPPQRVLFSETGEWLWTTAAVPKDRLDYPPITGMAGLEHGRIVIDRKYYPVIRSAKHRAAFRWPYKLLYEPHRAGVEYHLYKVDDDPLDEHDLREREPAIAKDLKEQLRLELLRHPDVMSVRDYLVTRPIVEEE